MNGGSARGGILVTGAAGFIGHRVSELLLERGERVLGWDNLNSYYDVRLKEARLARLREHPRFVFERGDVEDRPALRAFLAGHAPRRVVHLAARVGVRDSVRDPHSYVGTNLAGFLNVLEASREAGVEHVVYASSSSVYGDMGEGPFSTRDAAVHPISVYAATKRAGELLAHAVSHLHRLPVTGLRFFTVYGPWGRPDMAIFRFTRAIQNGTPIEVYDRGEMSRDFTYVDDAAQAVLRVLDQPPRPRPAAAGAPADPAAGEAPFRIYNVGNEHPVGLLELIGILERALDRKAQVRFLPRAPGDVVRTHADVADLRRETGYEPRVPIEEGIVRFVEWYRSYHGPGGPGTEDA